MLLGALFLAATGITRSQYGGGNIGTVREALGFTTGAVDPRLPVADARGAAGAAAPAAGHDEHAEHAEHPGHSTGTAGGAAAGASSRTDPAATSSPWGRPST